MRYTPPARARVAGAAGAAVVAVEEAVAARPLLLRSLRQQPLPPQRKKNKHSRFSGSNRKGRNWISNCALLYFQELEFNSYIQHVFQFVPDNSAVTILQAVFFVGLASVPNVSFVIVDESLPYLIVGHEFLQLFQMSESCQKANTSLIATRAHALLFLFLVLSIFQFGCIFLHLLAGFFQSRFQFVGDIVYGMLNCIGQFVDGGF